MKVHGSGGVNRATEIYRKQTRRSEAAGSPASRDQVTLSPAARDFQAMLDKLAQLPDVRPETVNRLRQQIADGTYEVPAERVADALLRQLKGL